MAEEDWNAGEGWYVGVPKIELHAHLNGSVRDSTLLPCWEVVAGNKETNQVGNLSSSECGWSDVWDIHAVAHQIGLTVSTSKNRELAKALGEKGVIVFSDFEHVILKNDRCLPECFKLFDLIRILTTDHATITRITKEVIEDFAADNVIYLELRTTPKKNPAIGMSKRSYMEAVVEGLRAVDIIDVSFIPSNESTENSSEFPCTNDPCKGNHRRKIYVRLLLSIDRRETSASAMETVQLALEMRDLGVVGIDLSGNPVVGEWQTFVPALEFAKEKGLLISLHCGEVPNQKEVQAMLEFGPQRIGHAICFGDEEWRQLKSSQIPVEICLTSNIRTETVSSINDHHFVDLYKGKHPVILCTDDPGVFSTSLSQEYKLAALTFGLGNAEMFQLARKAIKFIFADDDVKKTLKEIFDSASREFLQ